MMSLHRDMSKNEYFTKKTLLLTYRLFVGLNNKLYTMHGTYIKAVKIYCLQT